MTDFFRTEMNRLLDTLPKTDPASDEYHLLLRSIEYLGGISSFVDDLGIEASPASPAAPVVLLPVRAVEESAPAAEEPKAKTEPRVKLEDVRAVAATAKLKGVNIVKLIGAYGAKYISDVPQGSLPELLNALNEKIAEIEGEK